MATKTDLLITALTDRGMERDHNEDYHGYIPDLETGEFVFFDSREVNGLSEIGSLLILADGMGGTNAGEVASKIAVESVKTFVQQHVSQEMPDNEDGIKSLLFESIKTAQKDLVDHEKQFPETKGMGTTIVVAWVIKNKVFITWAGDSRLYLHNKSRLIQISHDHSFVQELVDMGKLTQEQAFYHPQSNIITQSLGDVKRPPNPGYTTYNIQTGDIVLICSDGLNGMVTDSNIEHLLNSNPVTSEAAKVLIDEANKAGGHDNITVLLVKITNVDSPLPVEQRLGANQVQPDTASNETRGVLIQKQKIGAMRGKILLLVIIIILLGFLAWQNKATIFGLFTGDKSNSIKNGDSATLNVKPTSGNTVTEPQSPSAVHEKAPTTKKHTTKDDFKDIQSWRKAKEKDTKIAYQNYLSTIVNGAYADSAKVKIRAIDDNKPVLDALKTVKDAYKPFKEDDISRAYRNELEKCIKKAEVGTITKDNINELWKAKYKCPGNETGIPELIIAVKNLFPGFIPGLTVL